MSWDPDTYLRFADHRTRPGLELLSRVASSAPRTIVDLGCGTGHLTVRLHDRWPSAQVTGIDKSADMIGRARALSENIRWVEDDIETWSPREPVSLIYSNAALHWLDDHHQLFPRLRSLVEPEGVLAVQMPDNWDAPTHRVPAAILEAGDWPADARNALLRERLADPADYRDWLAPAHVDLWRTTYFEQLTGPDPVLGWVSGSLLRPVQQALDESDRQRFADLCREAYARAYPVAADGSTTVAFSRLFIVARLP